MGYLDNVLAVAANGPTPDESAMIRRLASVAGSNNYQAGPDVEMQNSSPANSPTARPAIMPAERLSQSVPKVTTQQKIADIANQENALVNQPAHGMRRFLGDAAGIASGILTKNPLIGIRTADAIKDEPYNKAIRSLQAQSNRLTPVLANEQKTRTLDTSAEKANTQLLHNQEISQLGQDKLDLAKKSEGDINTVRTAHQKTIEELAQERESHNRTNEELNTTKAELERLKLAQTNTNQGLNRASKERNVDKLMQGQNARAIAAKNASPEEVDAASDIANQLIAKNKKEPLTGQELDELIRKGVPPKVRELVTHQLASAGVDITKIPGTAAQQLQNNNAKIAIRTIETAEDKLEKVKDKVGVVKGRIEKGKILLGGGSPEVQELLTYLNNVPIAESSAIGRSSKAMVDYLKKGSGNITLGYPELKAALRASKEFNQLRLFDQPTKKKDDDSFDPSQLKVIK